MTAAALSADQARDYMHRLLAAMVKAGGSDLFVSADFPPSMKAHGEMKALAEQRLAPALTEKLAHALMNERQVEEFKRELECNFAISVPGLSRFRVNAFVQQQCVGMVIRTIAAEIPNFEKLGLPEVLKQVIMTKRGLVLVVGPTGSGKSTTLAAMIDRINATRSCHILTIEDPVEYLHHHQLAMVNQREVGTDVASFPEGLHAALREDPDVILLGEMRDLESIAIALTLAETGHLVFATLHTNDAAQALDRVIDVFPSDRRDQIQVQLASTLQGVISQRLLPAVGGGRVAAYEMLVATEAVRNLVREGKSRQLRNVMIAGQSEGMLTLEMDLARLAASGIISYEMATTSSMFPKEVMTLAATQKAQQQAQATILAGQSATMANAASVNGH